jgi:phosphatidylglycerol lysyltransferase
MATARQLVMTHGWNATAYQILHPAMRHWSDPTGQTVVGYVSQWGVRVVAGAPVCEQRVLDPVREAFEADSAEHHRRVLYFCAAERLHALLRGRSSHAILAIGAQPVWDPAGWGKIVASRASLRMQLNRARNKGVAIGEEASERLRDDPELNGCLTGWLQNRAMPPMHFVVEPDIAAGELADRRLFVARRNGAVVGYLVASPVPQRNGFIIEHIIRGKNAPNGTAELMIDAAMRVLANAGCRYVTMGLVALSRHADAAMAANPWWFRIGTVWGRTHGRRFYHFNGLEQFRSKMQPDEWETIYAISNQRRFSPWMLWAVIAAFSNGRPLRFVVAALWKAAWQEVGWAIAATRRTTAKPTVAP